MGFVESVLVVVGVGVDVVDIWDAGVGAEKEAQA